jgi:hypothetical protein
MTEQQFINTAPTPPPFDIDYDARPSRTDIAKLELLATEIESVEIPERIRNYDAQDVAGGAEIELLTLAAKIREQIRRLR